MRFVFRLLLIAAAAAALLVGIQAPNFVDQYEHRLDAHFIEVRTNLAPFQEIADRLHGGSLDKLIEHHELSPDQTFHAEGEAIRQMRDRFVRFQQEKVALQTELHQQLWWLATEADRELLAETRDHYSFGILLDRTAVVAGAVAMLLVVIVLELLAGLVGLVRGNGRTLRRA
ncbi:MAG TPA: DUF2937 family protein [Nevskiaceae bacterium]|nr:DUF2937 family protein [Nevskiaceae bacterium]